MNKSIEKGFENLPSDVLNIIDELLSYNDGKNLRITCKFFNSALKKPFDGLLGIVYMTLKNNLKFFDILKLNFISMRPLIPIMLNTIVQKVSNEKELVYKNVLTEHPKILDFMCTITKNNYASLKTRIQDLLPRISGNSFDSPIPYSDEENLATAIFYLKSANSTELKIVHCESLFKLLFQNVNCININIAKIILSEMNSPEVKTLSQALQNCVNMNEHILKLIFIWSLYHKDNIDTHDLLLMETIGRYLQKEINQITQPFSSDRVVYMKNISKGFCLNWTLKSLEEVSIVKEKLSRFNLVVQTGKLKGSKYYAVQLMNYPIFNIIISHLNPKNESNIDIKKISYI